MKLTDLMVQGYRAVDHLRFSHISNGLNVVFGGNSSGKSTVAKYIRNVLYGFSNEDLMGNGHVDVIADGRQSRLSRSASTLGELSASDAPGATSTSFRREAVVAALDSVGADVFDIAFLVDGRRGPSAMYELSRRLQQHFDVPVGQAAWGNEAQHRQHARDAEQRQTQYQNLSRQLAHFESELEGLQLEKERLQSSEHHRLENVEQNLSDIARRIEGLNLEGLRNQLADLDRDISDLRMRIENDSSRVEYISHPLPSTDSLTILYRRLDETDNQIRLWRTVHADVQDQRVKLKDQMLVWNEMTIDSSGHPYHRAREILTAIESKVGMAEHSLGDFRSVATVDENQVDRFTSRLSGICEDIRGDLYSLCNELGTQYKHVRHTAATAELKRLRRCYEEIGENLNALIEHRRAIISDIGHLDPAGAEAVVRGEHGFCQCAQHEGYLNARRKFVGEVTTTSHAHQILRPDHSRDSAQLQEMVASRSEIVRELVAQENLLSDLEAQRVKWVQQRGSNLDLRDLQMRLESVEADRNAAAAEHHQLAMDIERDRRFVIQPANSIITFASEQIRRLTRGETRRIWLTYNESHTGSQRFGVEVEDQRGRMQPLEHLSSGIQQQLGLGLSLAIVENYRQTGMQLPLILDDVFVNLDPDLISATFDSLMRFVEQGHQVFALTADKSVVALATAARVTVFDMPETSVSPAVPLWTPERSPTLPPRQSDYRVARSHTTNDVLSRTLDYPEIQYPPTGRRVNDARVTPQPLNASLALQAQHQLYVEPSVIVEERSIHENTELVETGLLDGHEIRMLADRGIYEVGHLLGWDVEDWDFEESGLSREQIRKLQAQVWMLVSVPSLTADDVATLWAVGIVDPDQLENTHGEQLLAQLNQYLVSVRGEPGMAGSPYHLTQINRWLESLHHSRSHRNAFRAKRNRTAAQPGERSPRSNQSPPRERNSLRDVRTSERRSRPAEFERTARTTRVDAAEPSIARRKQRSERKTRSTTPSIPAEVSKLKFYLDLSDNVEAAPSIGPKTAERFSKIGVESVADFLNQTAESMNTKINYKRITVDVIRQWQHQARLVCRVPNLRGHDAQLLVGCQITEPEDLASRQPDELFALIEPFSESKEGLKIIRGGKKPDLAEVTDWIEWARQTRSLQAA